MRTLRPATTMVALALVAIFCLAGTASANVATRHHLRMYKVEKQVDLDGEFPGNTFHEHLFCDNGDYAVDGMWRIDHVDQANAQLGEFGDERDVQIDASYGDDVNVSKWHFRGINNADGRAQLKLFITCLGNDTTQVAGHTHGIVVSSRHDFFQGGVPSGFPAWDHNFSCGPDEIAVAPGFNFTAGSGRIFQNWTSSNFRSWHWAFLVNGPADVTTYLRCLRIETDPAGAGPHAHNILSKWRPGYGGDQRFLDPNITEERYNCGEHEKGLVAGFWIDDPFHVWWLGMDPRIKQRAFRFWNDGGGSNSVYLSVLCVNDRVGKQIAP